jgi:N-acyl-phosphatidylethanolamine-hydrolysing phospholipase D
MRRSLLLLLLGLPGCLASRVLQRVLATPHEPRKVEHKIEHPERRDARLAVLWVGHATALVQLDDRFILTDPVFTRTVGEFSPRLVEPGIEPQHLPPRLVVAVSHLHFDHLSYDSLEMLSDKIAVVLLPPGSRQNLPRYAFETRELGRWQSHEQDGLRVTAVPVRHVGGRFMIDKPWNPRSFTGYVFEYHGLTVYFGGDTVFDAPSFSATRRRFQTIDLALLPICPAEPQSFMQFAHMNPEQALDAFTVLGASRMVPIHFDTFVNSADRPGDCSLRLLSEMSRRNIYADRVAILRIGEQRVLMSR